MGFKDALKNLMYGQEPEDEFEGNGFEDANDEYYEDDVAPKDALKASPAAPARPSNVSVTSGNSIEMKVVKPEKLESVTQISDYLLLIDSCSICYYCNRCFFTFSICYKLTANLLNMS